MPAENLIGEEGQGFRYILDSMNAERILIASEAIGDGRWFVDKATKYATERIVFDRPIGRNQGVQFPIARAYAEIEAAALMVRKAAALFDAGQPCGPEANMAKLLGSEAVMAGRRGRAAVPWRFRLRRANTTSSANGARRGCFRSRRSRPISSSPIIAEHVLGMPRSY